MNSPSLPAGLESLLPSEAGSLSNVASSLLDWLQACGYRLVVPPLVDRLETLLDGADGGHASRTLRLTDPLGGGAMGIRADITPQIRRIDSALPHADQQRLCYCGPTLYARPIDPWRNREQLQLGAELFGAPQIAGDSEIILLAHSAFDRLGMANLGVALGHAGLITNLLAGLSRVDAADARAALGHHDRSSYRRLRAKIGPARSELMGTLTDCCGDPKAVEEIAALDDLKGADGAAKELQLVCTALASAGVETVIDVPGLNGYDYHNGITFALMAGEQIIARGGRYDLPERRATGFSTDVRDLIGCLPASVEKPGVAGSLHWDDPSWRQALNLLATSGKRLVGPDAASEAKEKLVQRNGAWELEAL